MMCFCGYIHGSQQPCPEPPSLEARLTNLEELQAELGRKMGELVKTIGELARLHAQHLGRQ